MEDYKVKYEDLYGFHVTEWMTYGKAKKFFNNLKGPILNTIWAELIYSPSDQQNFPDEEEVIDQFTYKVTDISDKKLIIN